MALSGTAHGRSVGVEQAHLSSAQHVFTAAQQVADHVTRGYGIPADRVTAIGGGLNYPLSAIPDRAPSLQPTILFVGHDFERKGGDILVKAFQRVRAAIPDARLLLVGRGAYLRGNHAYLQGNHPGVTVWGEIDDRHQLSALYRTATLLCLPARLSPSGSFSWRPWLTACPVWHHGWGASRKSFQTDSLAYWSIPRTFTVWATP